MARVLIVYHRTPGMMWRSTYASHLGSFEKFSNHTCYHLNTAWLRVPRFIKNLKPDLVIFHYTFLAVRWDKREFEKQVARIAYLKAVDCPKAIVPHDEHIYTDRIRDIVRDFGVTNVFTPASEPQWSQIYDGVDVDKIAFRQVLTGYIDEENVAHTEEMSRRHHGRPIDVGYRSWAVYPNFGRHSRLKGEIGRRFQERAPEFGLNTDISSDVKDALLGDTWFDFLLDCKYTIGVEGGASILDRDGGARERTQEYLAQRPNASFEEIEAACFPGRDGELVYRLLGPRHFEAVMTRTCQVLVEGSYGGALEAGRHYIPLQEDFSNLDEVLELMVRDDSRAEMVERAYVDIISSGKWTYRTLADAVFGDCLPGADPESAPSFAHRLAEKMRQWWETQLLAIVHRFLLPAGYLAKRTLLVLRDAAGWVWRATIGRFVWWVKSLRARGMRGILTDSGVAVLGEERLWRLAVSIGNLARRLTGRAPIDAGAYTPTDAEIERRARKNHEASGRG